MITRLLPCALTLFACSVLSGCGGGSGIDGDEDIAYVALGASDATGIGASPLSEGYVFEIEEGIQQRGFSTELLNLGIPGAEADQILDVVRQGLFELEDGDDIDLITLWTGSNDLVGGRNVDSFEDDLASILSTLKAETNAFIVMANVPNLTQLPAFIEEPDSDVTIERIIAFNDAIARQGATFNVRILDTFSEPIESYLVSEDGFHPNNAGHELAAQRFLEIIEPELLRLAVP